jgi:hypothetical protein
MSVVTMEHVKARREQVERCGKNKENVVFFEVAGFYSGKKTIEYRCVAKLHDKKHDHNLRHDKHGALQKTI